jgi:hypothetical protein
VLSVFLSFDFSPPPGQGPQSSAKVDEERATRAIAVVTMVKNDFIT